MEAVVAIASESKLKPGDRATISCIDIGGVPVRQQPVIIKREISKEEFIKICLEDMQCGKFIMSRIIEPYFYEVLTD